MPRIQLRVYIDPGRAEVFLNLRHKEGKYHFYTAVVDSGAETSLLPINLMSILDYRLSERGHFMIEQAGIAKQSVEVVEAYVNVFLEDITGAKTEEFEARVWFTDSSYYLAGFGGILERAVLHLDMPTLTGYLEFAE